jgi:malate dehydrogenase (oxaloacetate-decarboxylating)(NADP+)
MVKNGCTLEQARSRIYLIDSKGLIVKNRPEGGINSNKAPYAKDGPAMKDLGEVIDNIKPTAIIGKKQKILQPENKR